MLFIQQLIGIQSTIPEEHVFHGRVQLYGGSGRGVQLYEGKTSCIECRVIFTFQLNRR